MIGNQLILIMATPPPIPQLIYIFSIAVRTAVSGFVPSLAVNREYTGWLKDRVLKPTQKLSFVVTFVPSESARPDQITDLVNH